MPSTEPSGSADHGDAPPSSRCGEPDLVAEEIAWLRALDRGTRVVDLAREWGYSERAMYRELRRLWDRLGATSRAEGMGRAAELGLLAD